jgi:hypothetical protein
VVSLRAALVRTGLRWFIKRPRPTVAAVRANIRAAQAWTPLPPAAFQVN